MALQLISKMDTDTRLKALISRPHWVAIDPETGATLSASHGRSRTGSGRTYILIVPNEPMDEQHGIWGWYDWDRNERKRFRAASLAEALEKGNEKLAKILAERSEQDA